jgi:cyanophycin synthetase
LLLSRQKEREGFARASDESRIQRGFCTMILDERINSVPTPTRDVDFFDIFDLKYYDCSNPYLKTAAIIFNFAVSSPNQILDLKEYIDAVSDRYPQFQLETFESLAHLFARTVLEVSKLDMDLHCDSWHVQSYEQHFKIAVQALHGRTSRAVVYAVWDWFEAITHHKKFWIKDQVEEMQPLFRTSVYGGPTVYALLKAAIDQQIPTFYLWDEGLMQYGYGKNQVRGIATTFNTDSHLDSDFTTRKDDCKSFLDTLGFPVPQGQVVYSFKEAANVAADLGYPVAVKPVSGHKGEGVTAAVQNREELELAFDRAVLSIPPDQSVRIIVEQSITGKDFRLLCVNNRFVAATERRPASVIGDGTLTIQELIDRENRTPARIDTPTSPLGKIKCDDAMERFLEEQHLSLDSVLEPDQTVYLRKVANLSAGGSSIDATRNVHPDNIILAQDIAQHFHLTCLGIDVIAHNLEVSWKESNFNIIEINAAPGIFMHLKPAIGDSVDVPSHILKTFFDEQTDARIPIICFNQISIEALQEVIDHILLKHPDWTLGAVCQDAVFINRSPKKLNPNYNINVRNLLRHPKLDLLLVEYSTDAIERQGMFHSGSDLIILDNPTEVEKVLTRDIFDHSTIVIKQDNAVSIHHKGMIEQYELGATEPFSRVYLKEIATIL